VLLLIIGFFCLVDPFELKVYRVKADAESLIPQIIQVLLVDLELLLDGSGLEVVKVLTIFWLVMFVKLVHREHPFALVEVLHELILNFGKLDLAGGF